MLKSQDAENYSVQLPPFPSFAPLPFPFLGASGSAFPSHGRLDLSQVTDKSFPLNIKHPPETMQLDVGEL